MNNIKHLPFPYEQYTKFNSHFDKSFDEYERKIREWVKKNTSSINEKYIDHILNCDNMPDSEKKIKSWIMSHLDKIVYMYDFSGLEFGIVLDERFDKFVIRFASVNSGDEWLYEGYDESEFRQMNILDKLEWLYENCEFVPVQVLHENNDILYDDSHKWSHIKTNKQIMESLHDYLQSCKYLPKDEVFYYIQYNRKTNSYYLRRDLHLSPKQ